MSLIDPSRALLAPRSRAEQGELRFARTAPRDLVHRSAIAEVLITDWQQAGADTFRLGAQWPRGHTFYSPIAGSWYDPLLAAESLRQASLLVGQTYYGVPAGHHCVLEEMDIEVVPGALVLGPRPAEIRLEISCTEVRREHGWLTAMTMEADLLRDDVYVGVGRTALRILAPAAYERLRGDHARPPVGLPPQPEPVPAAIVGRLDERDVVLGIPRSSAARTAHTWQLRIDPSHPVLFDRPVDHVPGMMLLEAARQAAQAVCAPYRVLPIELRSAFHRHVELDIPCHIAATRLPQADAGEDAAVRVTGSQAGELVFDSLVVASPCD